MERIDTGTGGRHGIFKRADACETDLWFYESWKNLDGKWIRQAWNYPLSVRCQFHSDAKRYKFIWETEKTEDEIKKGTEKVTEAYKDNKKVKEVKLINLYEINVLNGDGRVEELEDGKFTIAIAIPESEQKYDAYKVVYFDEEGKLVETLDAKLENGKVVFTTTHLSTYGVVGYNNVATKNPATNDMNLALILASIGLASAGAVLVSRKKLAKANR